MFLELLRLSAASHAMMRYDGQMGSLAGLKPKLNPSSPSWIGKVGADHRSRGWTRGRSENRYTAGMQASMHAEKLDYDTTI